MSNGGNKSEYFDKLGEDFETYMNNYDVERRSSLMFDDLLKNDEVSGRKVLEIGCGTGRFSEQIIRDGGELSVLDIGPNLVKDVSERLSCEGVVGDACELPFMNESFDMILSSECIEHTGDPKKAIFEMCRVCRKGGLVCLTTPNKLWYTAVVLSQILKVRKFEGPEKWIFPQQAASVMRKAGMTGITISGCHLWPFQLKFSRGLLLRFDKLGRFLYPLMINFGIIARKST